MVTFSEVTILAFLSHNQITHTKWVSPMCGAPSIPNFILVRKNVRLFQAPESLLLTKVLTTEV